MNSIEENLHYRLLVQGMRHCAIYMLTPQGTVVTWGLGAEQAQGYLSADIVGKHFSQFYTESDQENGLPQSELNTVRTTGCFEGEGWRVRKDGTEFWAHVLIDPIFDESGEIKGFANLTRDITAQRESRIRASEQERSFRLLVQGVTDYAIYMLTPEGMVSNWNVGAERAKGYRAEEIVGHHFSRFYTPEDRREGMPERALATALARGKFEGEGWRLRQDGSRLWAHVVIDPIRDENDKLIGYAKITRDMTEYKATLQKVEHVQRNIDLALENMSQGLCLFDKHEQLVLCNKQFRDIIGPESSKIKPGDTFVDLLWAIHNNSDLDPQVISKRVCNERKWHFDGLRQSEGSVSLEQIWKGRHVAISHRQLPGGGWVSTLNDVTERKLIEGKIAYLAHHDLLTGLPNRAAFRQRIDSELQQNIPIALLYLDLDRFKPVNDSLGHPAGDLVLKEVALRVETQLRKSDMGARMGGDEFSILLVGCDVVEDAFAFADRLIREIGRPIQIAEGQVTVGASVGIAMAPQHTGDADLLFRNADLALYAAKGRGRNCCRSYEDGMELTIHIRRELEIDLRLAMANGEFILHYQPVVDAQRGVLISFEALIRWNSPKRGSVPPGEFIPFAEEIGLMPELGQWILRTACYEVVRWPEFVNVAVNLSVTQIHSPGLVAMIASLLEEIGLAPARLELEITETAVIVDVAGTTAVLNDLRALGTQIALDDFGTGYSSLSFLRNLPFNRIKIDRSFITDLGLRTEASGIVQAIVRLCEGLGVAVTAEGVETEKQLGILREQGCSTVQGHLVCHPCTGDQLKIWFDRYRGQEQQKVHLVS